MGHAIFLRNPIYRGCLENADLENADLENADLENADLENADLENADLENADLENADLEVLRCLIPPPRIWKDQNTKRAKERGNVLLFSKGHLLHLP